MQILVALRLQRLGKFVCRF